MTVLSITCDNCGAKYKLPETFKGSQAKCQKCGSVIDVQKQRAATSGADTPSAAKPAAQKPAAAARPAIDRSKSEPKPVERAARPTRVERASKDAPAATADDGGKGRRGARGERPPKKSNPMPLVLSGVGLVVIAGAAAFFLMGGDDKPKAEDTAKNTPAAGTPADKPADKPAQPAPGKPAVDAAPQAPSEGAPAQPDQGAAAAPAAGKPADASAGPGETAPALPPAEPADADPTRPKRPWEKIKGIHSMADVRDPTSYPEVVWPATTDDAKKAMIRELCDDVVNGGVSGMRAKPKLAEIGHEALFGIVEKLRTLDYKSETGNGYGFEFNKLLEEMTAGQNAGFELVEVGEPIDPRKAEYNTMTVGAWRRMLDKFPDAESFKKDRTARLKKQAEADK